MTYKEMTLNYYPIDEYWKKQGIIKMRWTLWEHSELGDETEMIATNGDVYVYTQDDLQTTVDCLEDYTQYRFEE